MNTIGNIDNIYPRIKSLDFIGDVPSLIRKEDVLSFDIRVALKSEIKENPNNMIEGVKFSNL